MCRWSRHGIATALSHQRKAQKVKVALQGPQQITARLAGWEEHPAPPEAHCCIPPLLGVPASLTTGASLWFSLNVEVKGHLVWWEQASNCEVKRCAVQILTLWHRGCAGYTYFFISSLFIFKMRRMPFHSHYDGYNGNTDNNMLARTERNENPYTADVDVQRCSCFGK